MSIVLQQYPYWVGLGTGISVPNMNAATTRALTSDEITAQIDKGNPVIAGISTTGFGELYPPGMSEHVALIIGYEFDESDRFILTVNDPYPFFLGPTNPYLQVGALQTGQGQYKLEYDSFVRFLDYKDTITVSTSNESSASSGGSSGCFLQAIQ